MMKKCLKNLLIVSSLTLILGSLAHAHDMKEPPSGFSIIKGYEP